MERTIKALILVLITSLGVHAQVSNTLMDANFWKGSPDIDAVKAEVAKGNSPTAMNENGFDPTVMAINNHAPTATVKYLIELEGNGISKVTHDSRIYLHWAALAGDAELVEYLLAQGSDITVVDTHDYVPIAFAANAAQSNLGVYEAFFKSGTDPKKKYNNGASLLLMAIANDKDFSITNYFVSKGMSLTDQDNNGNTAFTYSARSVDVPSLKSLLSKGVKANDQAILYAAMGSRRGPNTLEVFKYLVEDLKLKATVTNEDGQNVLHYLARRPNQTETITYFIEKGVDVNKADKEGTTPLMNAAYLQDTKNLELLFSKTKNINAVNAEGESALTMAVRYGSPEVVAFLLDKGADVTQKDKEGNTLAYQLIQSYRPAASDAFAAKLKLLQDKKLNIAATQSGGNTLYHLAISKNDVALLKTITILKIDVNAKNDEGMTALHKAAMQSRDDSLMKYLLSIGASKSITTEFDETAYALATENELLVKNNVSLDFLK